MLKDHLIHRLEGKQLKDGWTVEEKFVPPEGMTGSAFSIGYSVRRDDGASGFMKVLDVSEAHLAPDFARTLQALTEAFNFERDLFEQCRKQKMSKVVTALSDDTVREVLPSGEHQVAQYIIFEMAAGNLRERIQWSKDFDVAMELRSLHNVATGLSQLHRHGIAHQDVKPSNVMVFGQGESKVGDLGRSSQKGMDGPHDDLPVPGDTTYAPIEQLYGHISPDWKSRRLGSDLYQLGSLVVYVYTHFSMTHAIITHTRSEHRPATWQGTFDEILPYLTEYFRSSVEKVSEMFPSVAKAELTQAVSELCCPDPKLRGHPRSRASGNPMGLERYISLFNRLAAKAEIAMQRSIL